MTKSWSPSRKAVEAALDAYVHCFPKGDKHPWGKESRDEMRLALRAAWQTDQGRKKG